MDALRKKDLVLPAGGIQVKLVVTNSVDVDVLMVFGVQAYVYYH